MRLARYRQRVRGTLVVMAVATLAACGGSSDGESAAASVSKQFSVDLTDIQVVRLDNSEPVTIEGTATGESFITLED